MKAYDALDNWFKEIKKSGILVYEFSQVAIYEEVTYKGIKSDDQKNETIGEIR